MSRNKRHKYIILLTVSLIIIINIAACKRDITDDKCMQWAIRNNGEKIYGQKGRNGVDIGLPDDSALELDNENNIICIVDSKIDISNPLIKGLLCNDLEEMSGYTGISHGTYVTGIICSNAKEDEYVSMLKNARIYYIEIESSKPDIDKLIEDLQKAETFGAKVVNCSFVMNTYNEALFNFIKGSSMLFVCAVGNNNKDEILYPALYDLDNVISVVGVNNMGFCGMHSNYSENADIAAPGENILCITNEVGTYETISGSSLATAYVTCACAYIFNKTDYTAQEGKTVLLEAAISLDSLKGKVRNGKFMSIRNIIEYIQLYDNIKISNNE